MTHHRDAGIEEVMWVTAGDERVCEECRPLDGQVFRLDQVPPKHWGCRCILIPAGRAEVEA
jgi:SPP1 gp7 family putative phage head morphogenesis protein